MPEQRALEKALRNNPARPNEPPAERWQRIADEVGTRTRRECMLRFKDLAEQVRRGVVFKPLSSLAFLCLRVDRASPRLFTRPPFWF